MSEPVPIRIEKLDSRKLLIEWSDGVVQQLPFRTLRNGCQCATCNDQRTKEISGNDNLSSLPILTAAEAQPLDILKMHPVGNYAYNIHFSDGHNTGIFTFELLRSLTSKT
jgi:DUF971 family protein